MHIIAFITDTDSVRKILDHISESTLPPKVASTRHAAVGGRKSFGTGGHDPLWEMSAQPVPEFEFDQRIAW